MNELSSLPQTMTGHRFAPAPSSHCQKGAHRRAERKPVWLLIEDSRVRVLIDSKFPLADARHAHQHMEAGRHIGKILLIP